MSKQYPGGIVSKTPVTPTSLSAPGIWTMNQQAAAQATNTWPFPRDPQFKNVTMLLHGDGSAGPVAATGVGAGVSSTVTNFNADASTNNFNVVINGDTKSNNFNPYQAGYYSNYCGTSNNFYMNGEAGFAFGSSADFTIQFWFFANTISADVVFYDGRPTTTQGSYPTIYLNGTTKVVSYVTTSAERITGTTAISVGTWYNVVLSRVSGTTRLFVNGTSQGSWADTTTYANPASRPNICVSGYAANGYLDGYISNLSVLNGTGFTTVTVPTTPSSTSTTNQVLLLAASNRFIDSNTATTAKTVNVTGSPQVSPAQPFTLPSSVATYGSGYFDGSNDGLILADDAAWDFAANNFTIEFWVNLSAASGEQFIFSQTTDSGPYYTAPVRIQFNGSQLQVFFSTTLGSWGTILNSGAANSLNTWYHFAVVRNGTAVTVYRNGAVYDSGTQSGTLYNSTALLRIGYTIVGGSSYASLTGYISDLRSVNGTAVYTTTFTPPTSPLTAITNTKLLTTQYNGGGNNSGFKDSSQFNFPITRNGNTTQGTFTPYGSNWSNYFGGSSGLIGPTSTSLGFGSSDFTVEFWANIPSTSGNGFFASVWDDSGGSDSNSSWLIRLNNNGTLITHLMQGASTYNTLTSGQLSTNTWFHCAFTRNSGTIYLFINGVLAQSAAVSGSMNTAIRTIKVGYQGTASNYLTGYVSSLRVINGTCLYTTTFTPSTTPLTAVTNTQFLSCQSNRFVDNSTNAATITTTGSPTVQRFSPFAPLTVYNPTTYGGSGYFDGTGDWLSAVSAPQFDFGTGNFTLECWAWSNNFSSDYRLIAKVANISSYGSWQILIDVSGYPRFYASSAASSWDVASNVGGGVAIAANTWNHIAVTRSGTTFTIWVNGVSAGTTTSAASIYYSSSVTVTVGGLPDGTRILPGYITDARILKGTAQYTSAFTPTTTPLTAITNTSLLLNYTNAGILDNAMMNNLETVGNAQISTSVKKYGTGSMYFDGTGDWLMTPNRTNLNVGSGDFTVEAWVYTGSSSQQVIIGANRNSDGVGAFMLNLNYTGKVRFFCSYSGGTMLDYNVGSGTISDSAWHHIAVTRSGSSLRIFIDGTQTGTTNTTLGTASIDNAIADYRVGSTTDGALNFNGYIDDLRITKYARYTATFTVPDQAFPNG